MRCAGGGIAGVIRVHILASFQGAVLFDVFCVDVGVSGGLEVFGACPPCLYPSYAVKLGDQV